MSQLLGDNKLAFNVILSVEAGNLYCLQDEKMFMIAQSNLSETRYCLCYNKFFPHIKEYKLFLLHKLYRQYLHY